MTKEDDAKRAALLKHQLDNCPDPTVGYYDPATGLQPGTNTTWHIRYNQSLSQLGIDPNECTTMTNKKKDSWEWAIDPWQIAQRDVAARREAMPR